MTYFERTLETLRLFGGKVAYGLTVPNAQNAKTWLDRIENELSPENLTCDGELRGSALRAKERDWLDPDLEAMLRTLVKAETPASKYRALMKKWNTQ